MPQGSKKKYTPKQRRKAEHIEEGYKKDGVSAKTAAARAWATVNKQDGGAQGGGSATKRGKRPSKKARSDSAKKAAATRRRNKAKSRRTPKRATRSGAKKARKTSK
jgi:plasmid stabilization system protein ParE